MAIPNKRTSADFTFKHSGQVDEYGASIGDATVIQANFDQRAIDNMTAINNLIDSLIDTTEGSTGADSISSTPLSTGVYSNIQANLEFLQQAINDVVLGQIPDGSLTYEKLSPSLVENLATVENLKTLTKNGIITDELNEMAISANDPNDRSINIDTGKLLLNGSVYTYDTLMNVSIDAPEVENVPSEPHTLGATGNLTLDHTPIGKADASALAEVGDIVVTDVGTGNPINVTSIDPSTGEVVTEGTDGTTVSVSYYPFTKRIDVVYADINDGTINVEKGTGEISGTEPTKPTPADALELCEVVLDFNYTVISDTEITSSMLYGGFRGLGQVPLNAWNYIMFKNELTEQEITDIENNSSLMDIIRLTNVIGKKEFLDLEKLQAYDMAMHDVNDHISQPYSGVFYDLFYAGEPENSIGYIDLNYVVPSSSLTAGDTSIPVDEVASVMTNISGATKYEFTVQDESNRELVLAKTNGEIAPTVLSASDAPFSHTFAENGILSLDLKGSAGEDRYGSGGNGGEVLGTINVLAGDTVLIEHFPGGVRGTSGKQSAANGGYGGAGFSVKINNVLAAVVAGGGGCGGVRYYDGNTGSPANGGHGGGDSGNGGVSREGGGGTGGTQTAGGTGGVAYGTGGNAGENGSYLYGGKGGSSAYADSSCGGGGGGFGYYGGGGGGGAWRDGTTSISYEAGGGGGGSSYVGGMDTVDSNTLGTNNAPESALVSSSTSGGVQLLLDEPLINSYVSPTIYRSWVNIDTTGHKANPKQINATDISEFDVRYKISSLEEFDELATWLTCNVNLSLSGASISFNTTDPQDESMETMVFSNSVVSDTLSEFRSEINKTSNFEYATIRFSFVMGDPLGNNDIHSILGVVS